MGLSQVYYGSDPRKIAENNQRNVAVQGDALLDANKQQQGDEHGRRTQTADYLSNIEDPLAQGKGGYNEQESSQINLSPEDKQNIISSAGISSGVANAAAVGDADRAAAATGGNPLAMATYRARAAQTQGANAGDAMTKARVAAQQAGSAGAQATGNARLGQQNQGLQYYQQQNEQSNADEQAAAQRQTGVYGTETSGGNAAAQTNLQASQTPSLTSQIIGGVSKAAGAFLADGDMMPGTNAVVGEAGPEKVIQMPNYRAARPAYMEDGGYSEGPEIEGQPPGGEVQYGDDKQGGGWLARLRSAIHDNSGQADSGGGRQQGGSSVYNPNSPGATYTSAGQQLGAAGAAAFGGALADGGSPDPGMPSETGIFTKPTHIKMQPGEAAVPLTYRANAKLRPSMAFKAPAVTKLGGHTYGKHSYV